MVGAVQWIAGYGLLVSAAGLFEITLDKGTPPKRCVKPRKGGRKLQCRGKILFFATLLRGIRGKTGVVDPHGHVAAGVHHEEKTQEEACQEGHGAGERKAQGSPG